MPTPIKRSQRPRRDSARKELVSERPDDSSPSRPAKRRKKAEDSPKDIVEEEGSSLVADESAINLNDYDQVVSRVAQHLLAPRDQTIQASKDHSNAIHESNKAGVQAYAKIAAQDWTFYVTKLAVNIGRSSDPLPQHPEGYDPESDEDYIHIDLGPSKMISRQHAIIYFNSNQEKWFLQVKGRNGVKIDGNAMKQGESGPLASGEVLEIGGIEMMFVLPSDLSALHIHPTYLERAGLSKDDFPSPAQKHRGGVRPTSSGDLSSSQSGPQSRLSRGQQPIAPAPPDYKRPGTPPSVKSRVQASQNKSPQARASGTMLMHTSDVDLSLDENQNIKPQYSYAQMITQAIMNTADGKLNLNGIYNFIMNNYSYYRHQQAAGWQNSIRHNLSLNKAFEKVARSTDEPGKGMKWQIVPEVRDDMVRNAYKGGRGGHRGSSNPSSPNQLNYITQGPKDMAAKEPGSSRKRKVSPSGSPQPRSSLRNMHMTPDRSRRLDSEDTTLAGDGSPLPRLRKTATASAASLSETAPRSPTLTSSYLQEEGASFVTPAPLRVHPKLAPPSTAQRPSQHMPTSSPAPFWKYAEIGSTPLKPAQFDLSPSRTIGGMPQSSSPPPDHSKSPVASPSRGAKKEEPDEPAKVEEVEEDGGFDLTKGFQSIGSYHAPVGKGLSVATAMNGGSTNRGS